ncbi:amino acid/amide ABC transporter ATP-binding protein 2, HAAT family [Micromonospora pallida]|uniref:Amino acid/amide ABC transporter ATP-binding protein 2, HAAT family n=1 Tax=Micromonospora pallida TaxID=145854 RepID=A0A1C6SMS8_9ACTN|nr:ABC transporter ATP-binding protein [Micromonospora pallida]SCL30886.1 amino acid/amide ABC transporter ATP-binding protein 2, HAAT family [Micromonospora pallida]
MLRVDDLSAWYGEAQVLRGVSLTIDAGEVVTLVGRNGAGKSTLLRCVMGLHAGRSGTITLDGRDVDRLPAHRRARLGLGWVPDDRGAYATLSVTENLTLPPKVGPDPWPLERVYEAFPALYARRDSAATQLSGGEQQMLALARVLRMGARLLLCDEPTEGLSPLLVGQVGEILRQAKQHGVTVLLVEQNLHFATGVADRHYLLAEGRIVEAMDNSEVRSRERELLSYLGI